MNGYHLHWGKLFNLQQLWMETATLLLKGTVTGTGTVIGKGTGKWLVTGTVIGTRTSSVSA